MASRSLFSLNLYTPSASSIGYVDIGLEAISLDGNLPFTGSTYEPTRSVFATCQLQNHARRPTFPDTIPFVHQTGFLARVADGFVCRLMLPITPQPHRRLGVKTIHWGHDLERRQFLRFLCAGLNHHDTD